MSPKYRPQQPRRILASKLLKHIKNFARVILKRVLTIAFYHLYIDLLMVMLTYMRTTMMINYFNGNKLYKSILLVNMFTLTLN